MEEYLRIGQLAARLNLNPKTIRFYEQLGLVDPARDDNGYRLFSPDDAARLRFILRAKNFGLKLSEIGDLLAYARSSRCQAVKSSLRRLARQKIAEIDARMQELAYLKKDLESLLRPEQGEQGNHLSPNGDCSCL